MITLYSVTLLLLYFNSTEFCADPDFWQLPDAMGTWTARPLPTLPAVLHALSECWDQSHPLTHTVLCARLRHQNWMPPWSYAATPCAPPQQHFSDLLKDTETLF